MSTIQTKCSRGIGISVFLTDLHSGKKKLFYKYGRNIAIVWSPFSDRFAVNDFVGSNLSEVFLYDLVQPDLKIDLDDRLSKSGRPRREQLSIETADHVYTYVLRWLDRDQLLFKVRGYNGIDEDGFTLVYRYNVRDNSFVPLTYLHAND